MCSSYWAANKKNFIEGGKNVLPDLIPKIPIVNVNHSLNRYEKELKKNREYQNVCLFQWHQ